MFMKLRIAENVKENTNVFTGIAGYYMTTPAKKGNYSLYEIVHESENGLVHDEFIFIMEELEDIKLPELYIKDWKELEEDEGWEDEI